MVSNLLLPTVINIFEFLWDLNPISLFYFGDKWLGYVIESDSGWIQLLFSTSFIDEFSEFLRFSAIVSITKGDKILDDVPTFWC